MGKKRNKNAGMWIVGMIALVAVLGLIGQQAGLFSVGGEGSPTGSTDGVTVLETRQIGASSTLTLNAFTGDHGKQGAKTEVYPVYTVKDNDGNLLVNDVNANTTSTSVGKTVTIYGTGASNYIDPVTAFKIENEAPSVELKAHTISATTDLVWTCYDDDESTALTADDHANNTADYNGGALGAGEDHNYFCKLKNNVADKTFRLGAIATYYCGDEADDFELIESGWTEVSIPSGVMQTAFSHYDDTNASTSCNFKRAYVPTGGMVTLQEWQDTGKLQFLFQADDTTGPSANGDTYFGAVALDTACEIDLSGNVVCDWYKHDTSNDPGQVGQDENAETAGFKSLDNGFAVEPQ